MGVNLSSRCGRAGRASRPQQGVGAGGLVEVLPDGVVVHGGGERHEHVPDGVSEGDDAVALEEDDAQAVDQASADQLVDALRVALQGEEGGGATRSVHQSILGLHLSDIP